MKPVGFLEKVVNVFISFVELELFQIRCAVNCPLLVKNLDKIRMLLTDMSELYLKRNKF